MSHRVLLAIPDDELASRAAVLLDEVGDVEVVATSRTSTDVLTVLTETADVDVVVLHDAIEPLPVLDLARDLNHRFPQVAVVLVSSEQSPDLLRAAMGVGIRAVVPVPLTLAELYGAVTSAAEWAQAVQVRLRRAAHEPREQLSGRVIGLAGAKGGVGTTTVAVQLALELQRRQPDRSVCLVDLDLQTGDVRAYLDLTHRRSIADLVDVASELTTGHLQDAMFTHATGLRVLLPPVQGEDAEDLDDRMMTRIIGGIRARFDIVVLDLGTTMTAATAAAAELADELLIVSTPDVVALRGANRLLNLWRRLHVRDDGAYGLLNQVDRNNEVTPQLAERVLRTPLLKTTVPAAFRHLEAATNTGVPERVDGPVREAVEALATELSSRRAATDESARPPDPASAVEERVAAGELGAISIDFVATLGTISVVLLLVWQFVLTGYTVILAQHAAREGARAVAVTTPDDPAVADRVASDLPGAWRRGLVDVDVAADEVAVTLTVPVITPGLGSPWTITTSSGTVVEGAPG